MSMILIFTLCIRAFKHITGTQTHKTTLNLVYKTLSLDMTLNTQLILMEKVFLIRTQTAAIALM